jgi:hypothetical protein
MLKSCIAMTADSHSINNKNKICKLNNNLKNSLSLLEDLKFADFVFVVQLSFSPCDKNLSAALAIQDFNIGSHGKMGKIIFTETIDLFEPKLYMNNYYI